MFLVEAMGSGCCCVCISVSKGRGARGQTGTGRPVVPLSRDKKKFLSQCPVVPGQGQEQLSRDKLLCPGTLV